MQIQLNKKTFGPIYFPIETMSRELDAKLLLSAGALTRGYSIILGKRPKVLKTALNLCQGIYMYKDHTDNSGDLIYGPLCKSGIECISLDEEGLVFENPESYIKNRVQTGVAFDHIKSVFCWGEEQYNVLVNYLHEMPPKFMVTGNPRIDLLRKPYRDFFSDQVDLLKKKFHPFVLVNTNFTAFNRARFYKNSVVNGLRKNGIVISAHQEALIKNVILYHKQLYEKYVQVIIQMSEQIKNIQVVVRPHPSEEISTWQKDLHRLSNVNVIRQGNVINWILSAKVVIHKGCTTGIEAFLLDKPVLRYHPVYEDDFEPYLPNCFGESYTDSQKIISRVREICSSDVNTNRDENSIKVLEKYIENITGPFAYEKILDEIDKMENGLSGGKIFEGMKIFLPPRVYLKRKLNHLACKFENPISRLIGQKKVKKLTGRTEKFSGISAAMVEKKLVRIFKAAPTILKNPGFSVKEIEGDVVIISPHGTNSVRKSKSQAWDDEN